MEENQFRIWDEENQVFDYFDFNDLEKVKDILDTYLEYFSVNYLKNNPEYLMQYVGFKDKNNVKIYKGDIVKHPYGIGVVKFKGASFYIDGFYCSSQDNPTDAFGENATLEVVGNILEHNVNNF